MPTNRHWPPLAKPPELAADDVHAWAVPLDVSQHAYESLLATLASDEAPAGERVPFRRSQAALRDCPRHFAKLLGEYLHCEPTYVELTIDQNQKPHLARQARDGQLAFQCLPLRRFGGHRLRARLRSWNRRRATARRRPFGADCPAILPSIGNKRRAGRTGVRTKLWHSSAAGPAKRRFSKHWAQASWETWPASKSPSTTTGKAGSNVRLARRWTTIAVLARTTHAA